jgi:hypothetical protein
MENVREITIFNESHPDYRRNAKMVAKLEREVRRRTAKKNSAERHGRDRTPVLQHGGLTRALLRKKMKKASRSFFGFDRIWGVVKHTRPYQPVHK